MNGEAQCTLDVPLGFLDSGRPYVAHIYYDDPAVQTRTQVKISRWLVDSATVLETELAARGGQAIRICPAAADELKARAKYQNAKIKRQN